MGQLQIEQVVTSGTFSLDGGSWDVDNNVWLVGDDREVLVIDAAHDAEPILAAVGGRLRRTRRSPCTRPTRCSGRRSTTTSARTSTPRTRAASRWPACGWRCCTR